MRICDRCKSPAAVEWLRSKLEQTEYDLCRPCADAFQDWLKEETIEETKRGRGRPRNDTRRTDEAPA